MKPQIAHTCIVANYQTTYDLLDVVPTESIWLQAERSPNRHYLEDLDRRATKQYYESVTCNKEPTQTWLYSAINTAHVELQYRKGIHECFLAPMPFIDVFLCSSEDLRGKAAGMRSNEPVLGGPSTSEGVQE
jgi:hypothetical protein